MPSSLTPGQPAGMIVTFIEERAGRAIVRLPNGSKTTVDLDSLRPRPGRVHFVRMEGTAEEAWCQICDWSGRGATRIDAENEYFQHVADDHPEAHE
jgi:hypothetical protein